MIATDIADILFGTPAPVLGQANLGVLKKDMVNVVVHGHEPTLSEMIVAAIPGPGNHRLRPGSWRQRHQPPASAAPPMKS